MLTIYLYHYTILDHCSRELFNDNTLCEWFMAGHVLAAFRSSLLHLLCED
jgi:hypothetical protein